MNYAKKLVSALLALIMVLSLSVNLFAATKGSVSINGALKGNTFTLYKIFDLESYSTDGKYAYMIRNDSPLYDTIQNMTLKTGTPAEEKSVFELTSKNAAYDYVHLTVNFQNIQNDSTEIKAIASQLMEAIDKLSDADKAKLSMRQVQYLGVTGQASQNETKLPAANAADITTTALTGEGNENKYNITFSNLELGYYLVDSSAGTMIGLTTTNPNATITAKNELPHVVKQVKRNVNNTWDKSNAKVIGETVNYRVKVGVKDGATNYIIYDSLSQGLTFDKITKVYYGYENNPAPAFIVYDATKTTAINDSTLADYFTYTEATDAAPIQHDGKNCCFKMEFEDGFLQTVLNGTNDTGYTRTIYVEYDATLNEKAVIAGIGNPNDIYLTYGENNIDVAHDTATTYTYEMELVKTKEDNTVLTGAEFNVYTTRTLIDSASTALDQTEKLSGQLYFVKKTETINGKEKTVYRVATQQEIDDAGIETTPTIEAGDVIIRGLGGNFQTDAGALGRRYYFEETKAPQGYTLLSSSVEFQIRDANKMASFENGKYKEGGLEVENRSGSILPSTGGMGTTIFYTVGSILLVGSAVLLIIKRRMKSER